MALLSSCGETVRVSNCGAGVTVTLVVRGERFELGPAAEPESAASRTEYETYAPWESLQESGMGMSLLSHAMLL